MHRVLKVGLTGGIGSGKSVVAALLAARGAVIVDADSLAREVVAPGSEGLAEVVAAFGTGVLADDGSLDRAALAAVVFRDPQARLRLEAIVHPRVRARTERAYAEAAPGSIVVNDVPLLVEAAITGYDVVVVVDTPPELQVQRLVEQRGMTAEEATARIATQAGRERRLAAADLVVANDGGLDDLSARVGDLWHELSERRAALCGGDQDGG